jgi:hypothetical protein
MQGFLHFYIFFRALERLVLYARRFWKKKFVYELWYDIEIKSKFEIFMLEQRSLKKREWIRKLRYMDIWDTLNGAAWVTIAGTVSWLHIW